MNSIFMTFDQYQEATEETAIYKNMIAEIAAPESLAFNAICMSYCALGLGEAGEIQGKIKKILRDSGGYVTPEARNAIKKELGDLLWYIARLAEQFEIRLGEVAFENILKLEDRKQRGVLQGSGDDR